MTYGFLERIISHIVTIEPQVAFSQVSAPGDSGAWWLDQVTSRVIGLHFAGSNFPERALALDMPAVLDALNVDIMTANRFERARVISRRQMEAIRG